MTVALVPLEGQLFCRVDLEHDYDESHEARVITPDIEGASLVTSYVDQPDGGQQLHRPVLDLDLPAALVPSSTPGHFHLYIDHRLEWPKYAALLSALADAGILEEGYVSASLERGHTAVRLPWIKKAPVT